MKLIVGLGNPGKEYEKTRHNVGFMFIDFFATKHSSSPFQLKKKFNTKIADVDVQGEKYLLAKPQTYMNDSGRSIYEITHFYDIPPEDIVIVHDDLDIQFGEFKIQTGRGPKDHNGLLSIEQNLKNKEFTRVRIGVDARIDEHKQSGREYVLSNFTQVEQTRLHELFGRIDVMDILI